jgi:tape measure domain-containing protein
MANEEIVVQLRAEIGDLKSKLTEAQNTINSFGKKSAEALKNPINPMNQLGGSIRSLVGGYIGLQAAVTLVNRSFQESMKLDATSSALKTVFKSSLIAESQMGRLADMANTLGLDFVTLSDSYKYFAGAAVTSGASLEQTNQIFDSVARASAVLRLSADDTQGALRALGQMMSKGFVNAEELKGQLGDRLPGALSIMALATGNTTEKLYKLMETGKLLSSDVLPKFAIQLDKSIGGDAANGIESTTASLNRLKNAFTESMSGGAANSIFNFLLKFGTFNIQALDQAKENVKRLYSEITGDGFYKANKAFKDLSDDVVEMFSKKNIQGLNDFIQDQNSLRKVMKQGSAEWYARIKLMNLANEYINLLRRKSTNPIVATAADLDTIGGLTQKIKELTIERDKLKGQPLVQKQSYIDELTKKLELLKLTAKGITDGDIGVIEFEIKIKQESLKSLIPNSAEFKKVTKEIQNLQDVLNGIDPSSMDGLDLAIQRVNEQLNSLSKDSPNIKGLTTLLQYLTESKNSLGKTLAPPPVGLYNTLNQELNDLQESQSKATNPEQYRALGVQIDLVKLKLEDLTATTLTSAQVFTAAWQQTFNSFVQGVQYAFESALFTGKNFSANFAEMFNQMIRALMAKIAAAIVVAVVLFALLSAIGFASGKSFAEIAKVFGMTGVNNFGTLLGSTLGVNNSKRVVMPSNSTGQGGYQIDIMGDKMRLLLDNTAIKNSRVI